MSSSLLFLSECAGWGTTLARLRWAHDFAFWIQELVFVVYLFFLFLFFFFLFPFSQMFKGHIGKGVSHLGQFGPVVLKKSGKGEGSYLGKS